MIATFFSKSDTFSVDYLKICRIVQFSFEIWRIVNFLFFKHCLSKKDGKCKICRFRHAKHFKTGFFECFYFEFWHVLISLGQNLKRCDMTLEFIIWCIVNSLNHNRDLQTIREIAKKLLLRSSLLHNVAFWRQISFNFWRVLNSSIRNLSCCIIFFQIPAHRKLRSS